MEKNIKKKKAENVQLVVQELRLVNIDRTMKDIGSFIDALKSAESVYYPNRVRLYDLYETVTLDGHLTGIVNKRIDSILNKELFFYKNNKKVDELTAPLKSIVFRELKKNILETIFWGISGMQFIPGNELEFEAIPRKHIKPEFGIIAINQTDYEGIDYKNISNVWVLGKKRDYGLYLYVSAYALYKKNGFGDYAQYVEIFGQPIRVAKYDANDIKTKTQLTEAVTEAGSSLALIIPKQAEFEIMDGKVSNANGDLQSQFIDGCNEEMDIVILGNTETTSNASGGSRAKSEVQSDQQDEIIRSDMAYLLGYLNSPQFFNILRSYGWPVDGGEFNFEKEINLASLQQKSQIDTAIVKSVHLPVADDYWYETYGIEKPENYDELKTKQEEDRQAQQQAMLQPPNEKNENPKDKKTNAKKNSVDKKDKEAVLNWWDKQREKLLNFFDPAHKD